MNGIDIKSNITERLFYKYNVATRKNFECCCGNIHPPLEALRFKNLNQPLPSNDLLAI